MEYGVTLQERLARLTEEIHTQTVQAGRALGEARLIAVSKRQPLEKLLAAYELGVRDFGENTVQSLRERLDAFAERGLTDVRWHFIGKLQKNKAKFVAPVCYRVHSLDSSALGATLARRRPEGQTVAGLLQVNVGSEEQKNGVDQERVVSVAKELCALDGIQLKGLMCLPPAGQDPRPHFERLSELRNTLNVTLGTRMDELSMGMSRDFGEAIACGATWVRVGSALFGPRS